MRAISALLAAVIGLAPSAFPGGWPAASQDQPVHDWPQWGGPARDFILPAGGSPLRWPDAGPRVIWRRPLGEGYSSMAVVGDALFTMYRRGDDEVVVALDAASGATRWEHRYPAAPLGGMDFSQGPGPHATPLVRNGRVYAVGATGHLHALDVRTGAPIWSRRLIEDLGGTPVMRGYASSPLGYGDWIIVQTGGDGHAIAALAAADGRIVWRGGSFENVSSSPILADVDGEAQVIALGAGEVIGVDARTGAPRWRFPHPHRFRENIPTPIWRDGRLFVTSYADGGSRMLALARTEGGTQVRELWHHTRLRVYYTNVAWVDGVLYGSSGDAGPTLFTAVDAGTGDVLWQTREIARSSMVAAAGRLILRDEAGHLILARGSRAGVIVDGRAVMASAGPPTPPALQGTRVFLRDRQSILAVDLR